MHPPFGFALFYLRGIADTMFKEKRIAEPIKTNDIYMGSIPWVIMQILLVVIVIFVPQSVTAFLDKPEVIDMNSVVLEAAPAPDEAAPPDANANPAAPSSDDPMKDIPGGTDKK